MNVADHIQALWTAVAEITRKQEGTITDGTVHSVDAEAGTVRLKLGGTDDEPFLSDAIPYAQTMGALKVHTPPSEGQQMRIVSAAGDYRQGLAFAYTKSDANPSPSTSPDEHVATFGGATLKLDGSGLTVTKGGLTVHFAAGKLTVTGDVEITGNVKVTGNHDVTGSSFTHNGHDVGSTHLHTQVVHGGDLSGPPP